MDDDDGTLSVGDDVLAEEELGALLISAGGVPGDEFRLDGGSGRGWSFVSSYSRNWRYRGSGNSHSARNGQCAQLLGEGHVPRSFACDVCALMAVALTLDEWRLI